MANVTMAAPVSIVPESSLTEVMRRVAGAALAPGLRVYRPRWEDTPLLSGLLAAGGALGAEAAGGGAPYVDFVAQWLRLHLERPIAYGRRGEPGFRLGAPAEEAPRLAISDYCGSWGSAYVALQAYRATGDERFRDAGLEIARFVRDHAPRLLDGGFEHFRGNGRFWVDTLYYAAPLMALAGTVTGEPGWFDEAALQCEVHARYLRDPASGCFFHNYEAAARAADTTGFWARGNGWIAMSLVDVLAELPASHARRAALAALLASVFRGLLARQHPTGLWRVVLDHPDAYLETSGTAMIGYALARAAALGLAAGAEDSPRWRQAALRAWQGLTTYVLDHRGVVALMGAEAPAGGGDWERHKKVAVGEQPYATGPFLMLGACLSRAETTR